MNTHPKIKYLTKEEQESIGEAIHSDPRFGGKFPFEVELYLCSILGYDICPTDALEETCNVDTALIACKKLIRIQESTYNRNEARTRMSLAHELAHLVLHSEYIDHICALLRKANKTDEYNRIIRFLPEPDATRAEEQAFFTAGAIVAPKSILKREIVGFISSKVQLGTALKDGDVILLFKHLTGFFGITQSALVKRLDMSGLEWITRCPRQASY